MFSFFDAHLHPEDLSDADLEAMREFGLKGVLISSHPPSLNPTFKDTLTHFESLMHKQVPRLERLGISAYVALGVHPTRIPRRGFQAILDALPRYFRGGKVIALGEVGLETGGPGEQDVFIEQLQLARRLRLPVIVHTPRTPLKDKERVTRQALRLIKQEKLEPQRVLVDHVSARMARTVLASGHYLGITLHNPDFKAEKAVTLVQALGSRRLVLNSDLGEGPGDILGLPRAIHLMRKAQLSTRVIRNVAELNALTFLGLKDSPLPPRSR